MGYTDTHHDSQTAILLVIVLYHSSPKIPRSGSISLPPSPPLRPHRGRRRRRRKS